MTTIIVEIDLPDVTEAELTIEGAKWFPMPNSPGTICIESRYLTHYAGRTSYHFVGVKEHDEHVAPVEGVDRVAEAGFNSRPAITFEDRLRELAAAGHNVDQPIVIEYEDGTSATLPSLSDILKHEAAVEEEAFKIMDDMGFTGHRDDEQHPYDDDDIDPELKGLL
jgi:hypothetical protein